jgi:hypothetical protein
MGPRRSRARRHGGRSARGAGRERLTYRLTVRRGTKVSRRKFGDLAEAVGAMQSEATAVAEAGPLPEVSLMRRFDPAQRVAARLEISSGRWFTGRAAGVDVMGDGRVVPFAGGVARRELEPGTGESPYDAVRRELE